jgi:hypothetical protein
MADLSRDVFNKEMNHLVTIFNYKATKEQMELYFEYLYGHFSEEEFVHACKIIPIKENYFPSISCFFKSKPVSLFKKAF